MFIICENITYKFCSKLFLGLAREALSPWCKEGVKDCYPKKFAHIFFHVGNQVGYLHAKFETLNPFFWPSCNFFSKNKSKNNDIVKHAWRYVYLVLEKSKWWTGAFIKKLFLSEIIFGRFQNLKFWEILKEIIQKLLKTLKFVFVIFGGCPCKIGIFFDLVLFGIWVVIWLWKYIRNFFSKKA